MPRPFARLCPAWLVLPVVAALVVPAGASAAVPDSGNWSGSGPNLTFKVNEGSDRMTAFTAPTYPVYCFGGGSGTGEVTTRIFYVPSIDVAGDGTFNAVYHPTDESGNPDGELDVSGQFTSANSVTGKLYYSRDGCYAGADFSATATGGGPHVKLSLPKHQKVVKHRGIVARVSCSAACYMGAYADIKIGSKPSFEVDSDVFHLLHTGSKKIRIKIAKKQLRKIKAARKHHIRVVATVHGALTDKGGDVKARTHGRKLKVK